MKKTLETIKNIFTWLVVIFTVCIMIFTIVSVTTFDQNNRDIFGYKAFIVQSDSMSATDFNAGDLILVKEVEASTLQEGDIIAYISQNSSSFGETITHKIRKLTTNANGEPGFITYGTTTGVDDETIVTYPYVLGKYIKAIPNVGTFFQFLKTTQGYILCILIPFLLLIGLQGINTIQLFRQYKREQMEEINAEKAQLAEERKQSQEMMRELMELRKQLAEKENVAVEQTSPIQQLTDEQETQVIQTEKKVWKAEDNK